jgi:membrane protease YdiL (CAAX protease family)
MSIFAFALNNKILIFISINFYIFLLSLFETSRLIVLFPPTLILLLQEIGAGICFGLIFYVFSFLAHNFNQLKYIHSFFVKSISQINLVDFIYFCCLIPIFEELVWRILIFNYFEIYFNNLLSFSLISILFCSIHFNSYAVNRFNMIKLLDTFTFSFILCYIFFKTHSIVTIVSCHMIRNLIILYTNQKFQKIYAE